MDLKVLLSISLAVFAQILEVDSADCCPRSSAILFQTKWRLLAFDRLPSSAKVELVSALFSHVTNDDVIDAVRILYPTASGGHDKVKLSSHDATRILSFCDGIVYLLRNKRSLDQHLLHVIKSWPTEAAQIYSKLHSIKQALKRLFVNDLSNHDSSPWPLACLDGVFQTISENINQTVLRATCKLTKSSGDPAVPVEGVVNFAQKLLGGSTEVQLDLRGFTGTSGAPSTKRGFHIHTVGNLGNRCVDAGSHYNPHGHTHSGPSDEKRHVGDLGNIEVDQNGHVSTTFQDGHLQLHGEFSIIGRSVVVHSGEDDLGQGGFPDSKTTGHAGGRLGCCIIERIW